MDLWHVSEAALAPGAVIKPGRWGTTVAQAGQAHPFFPREWLLEQWRLTRTTVQVSRLNCAFAFDCVQVAERYARGCDQREYLYRVEPVITGESGLRLDMLWLTWMGEPQASLANLIQWCQAYWAGKSSQAVKAEAQPGWEMLFSGGLRVLAREGHGLIGGPCCEPR